MGSLHDGHSQLIKEAKISQASESSSVLVTIFINPLQFGPSEDFEKYPRDLDRDCEIAFQSGADAIWAPSFEEVFPGGINSHFQLKVPANLTKHLCGANRPNHFDGVATVIVRLLSLIKPQVLVLGEKDWQQLVILRHLINELNLPIIIRGVKTIREKDGLACSSRNQYLNTSEREAARELPNLLRKTSEEVQNGKQLNIEELKLALNQKGLKIDYVEEVDPVLLSPIKHRGSITLLAASVHCGNTRLIDHVFIKMRKPIIAIDGPGGAGKSTVTQAFAKKLGLIYLDTGAMYRAVTWLIQEKNININNESEINRVLENIKIDFRTSQSGDQRVFVNKIDVTKLIRSPEVTKFVSSVSALKAVRENLTAQQKYMGIDGGIVAEGRDIGTAVFPQAELKIFLTASPKERATRRARDLKIKGFQVPELLDLEQQIKDRDYADSTREISPLTKAKDAIEIITDGMSIEEVIESLIKLFRMKVAEEVWPSLQK